MRILQLHNKVPYPPKDGGAIGVWNFTTEFAKQGHDVTLFAMNTRKHYCDTDSIPEDIRKLITIETVKVDALITISGALLNLLFSSKPYNARRFISNKYKIKLIHILSEKKFDVIILEGLYMFPYISDIRKYSEAKVVFKAHNIEHEIWERVVANEPSFFKREYLKILSHRIKRMEINYINKADSLVTFTQRDANIFNSLGNKLPVHIAPAGIDTSHLIPDQKNKVFPSLFYIGALDWAPNQEALMWFLRKVWTTFREKYPDIKLEIAGRNAPEWFRKSLQEPNIVFLGEISDAYSYMNSRTVMLVPLLSGSGMRIKIVEGMALGKVIITTSIGTEGIDTTHNQNILIADTAEQYQLQLERAINDKSFCDTISQNAIKFVKKNFDISQITMELSIFLERQNRL